MPKSSQFKTSKVTLTIVNHITQSLLQEQSDTIFHTTEPLELVCYALQQNLVLYRKHQLKSEHYYNETLRTLLYHMCPSLQKPTELKLHYIIQWVIP